MHRGPLLELLLRYAALHPTESGMVRRVVDLVRSREDCLLRTCAPGHVTASAWIVSHDRSQFLLTHHRKLNRWLQLGGHVDGEPRVHLAALREAQEESGLAEFEFFPPPAAGGSPLPLDVDVHPIPARADEPAHEHHDVRFLLIAKPGQRLVRSDESNDLRWFHDADAERVAGDDSVLRLARKARSWLSGRPSL